jgi:hypothetical protein
LTTIGPRDFDHRSNRGVGVHHRARIDVALADEAVDRRRHGVLQVELQFLQPRLVLVHLRLGQVLLRHRRQVARLGVIERLLGQQLPREQVLRPFEVDLGDSKSASAGGWWP